jgi:hypothetical protein
VVSIGDFFDTVADDPRVLPSHIVLYLGLVNVWQHQECPEEFEIVSADLMRMVKLSRETFRRRLVELKSFGYIGYEAAGNQFAKAAIRFRKL